MATGDKLVTVAQAAEHLGKTPQGPSSTGSKLVTMGQLKSAVDGSDPSGSGKLVTLSQLNRVQTLKIVSWADGTDEEIAAMVAAADAGEITLSDYWNVGDTRTVHLAAMGSSVSNLKDMHAAQDVQFVLTDPGHYKLANGKPCNFVVLQKNCLREGGVMNLQGINHGGWNNCPRRTWCNNVYRNAIPSTLRGIFKQFTTYAANGTGSSFIASGDYFALFSEKEVFGSTRYANISSESRNSQLTWFKNSSNRIKMVNGRADIWWERSPNGFRYFCVVISSGDAARDQADNGYGLAPFGCI